MTNGTVMRAQGIFDCASARAAQVDVLAELAKTAHKEAAPGAVHFYVIRHGESLFNVMGKVQGWCDTPLTDKGIEDALELGRRLAKVEFAAAFSSDSCRAINTLDCILTGRCDVEGVTSEVPPLRAFDARLREWCYGDLEGEPRDMLRTVLNEGFGESLSHEEHNRRLPEVANIIKRADSSGRAETFDAIDRRLRSFFVDAGEAVRQSGGGNVLVVTHSFVVRTLIYLLDPSRVNNPIKIPNVSVTKIHFDGQTFIPGVIGSTDWQSYGF